MKNTLATNQTAHRAQEEAPKSRSKNLQPSKTSLQERNKEQGSLRTSAALLLTGIILIAANLRTPLTSLSPLLDMIRVDIPISSTLAGFLTTLPLLAFAGLSPFVPRLARQYGMANTLFAALLVLLAGSLVRQGGSAASLLLGTVLTGLGIAAGNVMLPALIKENFPLRLGLITGIYSISMNLFAAIASAASVPVARSTGLAWRGTMLAISLLALLAVLFWIPQLKRKDKPGTGAAAHVSGSPDKSRLSAAAGSSGGISASAASPAAARSASRPGRSVWRSGMAWSITLFMGVQSFIFYIFIAWLPDMLVDQGLTHDQAGYMLSLLQAGQLPFTLIIPIAAAKMRSQLGIMAASCCLYVIGFAGVLLADGHLAVLSVSVILLGVAGGTCFSLAMMFFSLRTRTAQEASEISGMAQSVGYLLAAAGPFLFGALHDAADSWKVPMLLLFAAAAVLILSGIAPSKGKSYVFPTTKN
ncbi:CynX/NimT family MFS transporter [Paenibacillus pinistramenti]|uniref:CynX/NimT family MFS transporter n=1 Tax=Paenibacillus pinistramenti TaxID=1768003 RepID=UPI001109E289|nr:MFS transporter [Paenibacillus pinistramenti]